MYSLCLVCVRLCLKVFFVSSGWLKSPSRFSKNGAMQREENNNNNLLLGKKLPLIFCEGDKAPNKTRRSEHNNFTHTGETESTSCINLTRLMRLQRACVDSRLTLARSSRGIRCQTKNHQWLFGNISSLKPNANTEPGNVNEGKGVGYLTEKLEVCGLAICNLTTLKTSNSPVWTL